MVNLVRNAVLGTVFFLLLFTAGKAFAFDNGDFQVWNTDSVSWKVADKWKLAFEEEFRFGSDAKDFYYEHSDLGFTYSGLAKWLDVGAAYRQVYEENKERWLAENQPHVDATVKWKLDEWDFSNRSRFEYRNREDKEDFWRYRDKFTLRTPFKATRFSIRPYVSDEVFYDFDVETVNKNRAYAGFESTLTKNIKAEIYYMREISEKNDKWTNMNVLGTKLSLLF